jgi:uncharacterized protein YkwD/LysM repeat protein
MQKQRLFPYLLSLILISLGPQHKVVAHALEVVQDQQAAPSSPELVNAVNALRLSYGLPPLAFNSILTEVAQSQADVLAGSAGASGHLRPNGMSLTDELISLGYPLAGDLSLGGYRAENWVSATGVQDAIQWWLGDEIHTNTMLSPNYLDIGAGISIGSDGAIYFVIDCARPTANGRPQTDYTPAAIGTIVSGVTVNGTPNTGQFMVPVVLSTPNSDGLVIHEVQYGQTLWSIAIAYDTKIQEIRKLNNLPSTDIYEKQKLVIKKVVVGTQTNTTPSITATVFLSPTDLPLRESTSTATSSPLFPVKNGRPVDIPLIVLSIVLCLLVAGLGFFANSKRA